MHGSQRGGTCLGMELKMETQVSKELSTATYWLCRLGQFSQLPELSIPHLPLHQWGSEVGLCV